MKRTLLLAALMADLVVTSAGGASAAGPTESEQRAACLGDALRLCAIHIPDRARIRACLGEQHASLSEGCRIVYDESVKAHPLGANMQR